MKAPTEAEIAEPETPPVAVKKNPDILWVQKSLNQLGVDPKLIEDGLEGDKTRAAIKWFQGIRKVPADGDAGPATMALIKQSLETDRADPVPPPPATELAKDGVSVGTAASGGLTIASVIAWISEKWDTIPPSLLEKAVWLLDKPYFYVALGSVGIAVFVLWRRNKIRLNFNI
jgi:peptidoglycan hydrolase-like protein with peptidoglycan-binding domain